MTTTICSRRLTEKPSSIRDKLVKLSGRTHSADEFWHPLTTIDTFMPTISEKVAGPVKRPLRELVEQTLLHHLGVSAALVKANGDILYLHGRTGLYLEPSSGEAGINNILKMARAGLSMTLPYHCNGSWRLGRSCTPRECRSKPTANLLKWSSVSAPSFLRR